MRIFIGGDITPTAVTVPAFDRADIPALFGSIPALLRTGDMTVANVECALTDSDGKIHKCGPNLKGRPSYADVIRDAGITHIGLANNHVYDFGKTGFYDTLRALDAAGLPYTGVGENEADARKPLYVEVCGKTVALVCVAEHEYSYALPDREGVWGFDPFETMEDIREAKSRADFVLVLYHGGKEQSRYPSPRLRKACRAMVNAGADFVTCQHSHCIGVYEEYRAGKILYGQGNFNFVGYIDHPHWKNGLLVQLDLTDDGKLAVTFHPVVITATGVTLAEGAERETLLKELDERNAALQDEQAWLKEWNAFCESMRPNYRESIARAFRDNDTDVPAQIFPHYLDCEAHTDVWRELYKTWNWSNRG